MTDRTHFPSHEINSLDVLELFWRGKHIVLACVIVVTMASYIASVFFMTSIFQAKTKILVREEKLNPADTFPQFEVNNPYLASQAEILKSDRLVDAAIAKIVTDMPGNGERRRMVDEEHIKNGLDNVATWVVGLSHIIELIVEHEDPDIAAALANALSRVYVEDRMAQKVRVLEGVIESHRAKLEDVRQQMHQSEQELMKFAETEKVALFLGTELIVDLNRYARFEEMRVGVDADAEKLKTQTQETKEALAKPSAAMLPAALNSPLVRDLKNLTRVAEAKQDELLANYTADHPLIKGIQLEISRLHREMEQEVARVMAAELKAGELEYSALQRKKEVLAAEQKKQAARLNELLAKQPLMAQMQNRVDAQRLMYQELLKEQNRLELVRDRSIQLSDGEIIQSAEVPEDPVSPDVGKNFVFGAMTGFTLGCALVLFSAGRAKKRSLAVEPERRNDTERRAGMQERRGAPRREVFYDVSYAKVGDLHGCQTHDMSATGMRIITEEALNKGAFLDFKINRPDMRPIAGKGSVVWSAQAQVNGKDGFFVSGLKFVPEEMAAC